MQRGKNPKPGFRNSRPYLESLVVIFVMPDKITYLPEAEMCNTLRSAHACM